MAKSRKQAPPTRSDQLPAKRSVEVVTCGSAFPISSRPKTGRDDRGQDRKRMDRSDKGLLDWNVTAQEVRNLGATAFVKKQKRDFEDEQYKMLTGRERKKHQVPLPIVRGIKRKAAEREARRVKEAKDAGIVLPAKKKQQKKADPTSRVYGPAPSIGFMAKGMLRVNKKSR